MLDELCVIAFPERLIHALRLTHIADSFSGRKRLLEVCLSAVRWLCCLSTMRFCRRRSP